MNTQPTNPDFHLNKQCQITDINCWRNELSSSFNCDRNDKDCWKNKVQNLPCDLGNVECWKKEMPDIPCDHHDKECWNQLLPGNMPCQPGDKECWDKLNQKNQEVKHPETLESPSGDEKFDKYETYGFGMI